MATTPFPFVASTVLTALQLNSTFNIPTTTKTASHTLIAADAGTRVIMNSASATSFTLDTSIFAASDVIELQNIGSGVATVTAGTATVSSAGPLAIPQNGGGRLVFSSASAATYFPTAVTASASGLTFITGASFSAVTSFSLPNDTFTSTHENYLLSIKITASTASANLTGRFRVSGTDNSTNVYQAMMINILNTNSSSLVASGGQTSFNLNKVHTSLGYHAQIQIMAPKLAEPSTIFCFLRGNDGGVSLNGVTGSQMFETGTAFDSFSVISSVASSITGNFKVYGYANT